MLLIPAIDLKDGKCVRLRQGRMHDDTIFSDNPILVAKKWVGAGARRLHLIDLNGAFEGKPINNRIIRNIVEIYPDVPIQVGGGIRDIKIIKAYLDIGIQYCILGTKALQDPGFISEASRKFPGRIIVGIDVKDDKVAIEGWSKISNMNAIELATRFTNTSINSIIYTDIKRDGMMQGINIKATAELAAAIPTPVIASGGIANISDIKQLLRVAHNGIHAAIVGRAIYEGTLNFSNSQILADG